MRRIAVIGHVEHVTLGRVDSVPGAGDIAHLGDVRILPGGGGALAFAQLARSSAEIHFFTALGNDDAAAWIGQRLARDFPNAKLHASIRREPHPHVVVMVDARGRRTIVVTREPLQPTVDDALPWSLLDTCDAVYFTGADPRTLARARAARHLIMTVRRRPIADVSGVAPDVAIGSVGDPRENAPREAWKRPPRALVLTDGPRPIRVLRHDGTITVSAPAHASSTVGDYGAGDSFAGALTYFLAQGATLEEAVERAGPFGAAVLSSIDPLEAQRTLA